MNKAKRDQKIIGEKAFHEFYRQMTMTNDEHEQLMQSLKLKNVPCILINPLHQSKLKQLWHSQGLSMEPIPWFTQAIKWPKEISFPSPLPGHDQHWFYLLNPASLLPVIALNIQPREVVLDACAAPGGKTLALSWGASANNITIVANELSYKRYLQLKKDMTAYGLEKTEIANLPAEIIGAKTGDIFDKILLDAPCSSEKHVMQNPKVLQLWTPKRITKLVDRQLRLIKNLFKALKIGGTLVYATCAVNTQENEGIVAKALKNMRNTVELIDISYVPEIGSSGISGNHPSTFDLGKVRRVSPHLHVGYDPMFVAAFRRLS